MTQLDKISNATQGPDLKNKIFFREGPPLLHAFESKISLTLARKKDFELFNTISNKGGSAEGIFILIPWDKKISKFIKITSIKIFLTREKEKAYDEEPFLLEKNGKKYLGAKFPHVKPEGYPFTDKKFIKTETNKSRFHSALANSTIWTSVKGIALKKGDLDLVVKTIPYNNEKKLSQPVTYVISIR